MLENKLAKYVDDSWKEIFAKKKTGFLKLIGLFVFVFLLCSIYLLLECELDLECLLQQNYLPAFGALFVSLIFISPPFCMKLSEKIGLTRGATFMLVLGIITVLIFGLYGLIVEAGINEFAIFITIIALVTGFLVLVINETEKKKQQFF